MGSLQAPAAGGEHFGNTASHVQVWGVSGAWFVSKRTIVRVGSQPPEAIFLKIRLLRINFGALTQSDFVLPMILGGWVWGEVFEDKASQNQFWGTSAI